MITFKITGDFSVISLFSPFVWPSQNTGELWWLIDYCKPKGDTTFETVLLDMFLEKKNMNSGMWMSLLMWKMHSFKYLSIKIIKVTSFIKRREPLCINSFIPELL